MDKRPGSEMAKDQGTVEDGERNAKESWGVVQMEHPSPVDRGSGGLLDGDATGRHPCRCVD